MSRMKIDRKPPLPKSPIRLRPRRVPRSDSTPSLLTAPVSSAKTQKPNLVRDNEELDLGPEHHSISCELRALAKMVGQEFGNSNVIGCSSTTNSNSNPSPLFERGRFYEAYSERRNERLKRKKGGETMNGGGKIAAATPYSLGVTVESSKRRSEAKKLQGLRKSLSAAYSVERNETAPRYLLRSMNKEENKKPPLAPVVIRYEKSVLPSERKIGARRVRKT